MQQSLLVYLPLMTTMILFGALAAKRVSLKPGPQITFFKWEVLVPLLCFGLVFGMRYGVGTDHLTYLNNYLTGENTDRYELFFKWVTLFLSENNFHFATYFGLWAFLQVFFLFYAFKEERHLFPYLAFLLFAGGYFLPLMNGIRQDLAACIFIYSIRFIDEKKLWKYLLWCTIAFLFHKSAVILFMAYPFLRNGRDFFKSIPLQLIILLVSLTFYYSDIQIEKYISFIIKPFAAWFNYSYSLERISHLVTEINTGIGFLLALLIDILIIISSKKLKIYFNSKRFFTIYNLYFIGVITRLLFGGSTVLLRPFRYFIYFKLIITAYFIYYLFKNAKLSLNQILFFLVLMIYLLLFGATLYNGDTNTAKFIFFWQAQYL